MGLLCLFLEAEAKIGIKTRVHARIGTVLGESSGLTVFAARPQFTVVWYTSEHVMTAATVDFWHFWCDGLGQTSVGGHCSDITLVVGTANGGGNGGCASGSLQQWCIGGCASGCGGNTGHHGDCLSGGECGTGCGGGCLGVWEGGHCWGNACWWYVAGIGHSAGSARLEQGGVLEDSLDKGVTGYIINAVHKPNTRKVWVLGNSGLKTGDKCTCIASCVGVALLESNHDVHDVAHLVELVDLGKLFGEEKLVGISGKILMEPDSVAILASSGR